MSEKKRNSKSEKKYRFLLDLIAIIVVSTFAYTTAMIVTAYQMGG
ncbi:MAG: hypothetical protein RLZZ223_229 [Candidatus Parcubacteria bacterium]|jgi:hypothetical protein